jgi:hypothetical protein
LLPLLNLDLFLHQLQRLDDGLAPGRFEVFASVLQDGVDGNLGHPAHHGVVVGAPQVLDQVVDDVEGDVGDGPLQKHAQALPDDGHLRDEADLLVLLDGLGDAALDVLLGVVAVEGVGAAGRFLQALRRRSHQHLALRLDDLTHDAVHHGAALFDLVLQVGKHVDDHAVGDLLGHDAPVLVEGAVQARLREVDEFEALHLEHHRDDAQHAKEAKRGDGNAPEHVVPVDERVKEPAVVAPLDDCRDPLPEQFGQKDRHEGEVDPEEMLVDGIFVKAVERRPGVFENPAQGRAHVDPLEEDQRQVGDDEREHDHVEREERRVAVLAAELGHERTDGRRRNGERASST